MIKMENINKKMKIAIYGGSFDMIHNGHIEVSKFVLNSITEFSEVWLTPVFSHVCGKPLSPPEHRLEMCRLAGRIDRRIKVCDYEIKHKLSGSTYNLMNRLINDNEYNEEYEFSVIIGLDNANSFNTWVDYQYLEKLVRFVVIPRRGVLADPKVDWYLKDPHIYLNFESSITECSSTLVRALLKENKINKASELVNIDVLEYIDKNNLYRGVK